ncbi:MAG: methyltransferase domain-containing protein [Bryobacterales bacterium]|nr:methyltransferase domain-containing protein [Bryobacterales bacterium]
MAEFTGERVIPGQVDPDLFNEHFARYAFAARLARGKRVLDIACGTGYGSAELAPVARSVTGVDVSAEAVEYAREHYAAGNLRFEAAGAEALPFADQSFDLVVAFEVIEHLEDARALLSEARRVLAPAGQFIVSTPNRLYYEETRRMSGPNPFHTHEFEYTEFREALAEFFPHVSLFVQNHSGVIVFQPGDAGSATEVRREVAKADPADSHFFVAVCALTPQIGSPVFVYVPRTSNLLREREKHIALLEEELRKKTEWLERALKDHEALVVKHREQTVELEARNRWAEELNKDLQESRERVVAVQEELAAEQRSARETVQQYEGVIAELEADVRAKAQWAIDTEARLTAELTAKADELAKCVAMLHENETLVEERTKWALGLQKQVEALETQVSSVMGSRWYRVGRTLGLGPELRNS